MFYTHLPNRAVLAVSGADAESFLQGLISNDLRKLAPGQMLYTAMLSPQGKFLHDFFIARRGDVLLLDVDATRANDLMARFNLYKLRAQVIIVHAEEPVTAAWGGNAAQAYVDPRLPEMGYRIIGAADTKGGQQADVAAYDAHRIALGVPDTQDFIVDKSFLLEMGFEDLHGVDFGKGCYVGQEVTARSKFRGQVRKHLYQVRAHSELPPLGTKILQDGADVGELRSHAGNIGLAILRTEAVEKPAPLTADGVAVAAALPRWAHPAAA